MFTRPDWPTNTIQSLNDEPTDQATAVKQAFDKIAVDSKDYLTDTLLPELESDYVRYPAYGPSDGSSSAYTFASTPALPELVDGVSCYIKFHTPNSSNATLNWDDTGAHQLVDGNGNPFEPGKLTGIKGFRYNATAGNFQLQGEGRDELSPSVGDNTIYNNPAIVPSISLTYVKAHDVKIKYGGSYRIKFDMKNSSQFGDMSFGLIYKNDSPYGTERTSFNEYVTFTEDLDFEAGDNIQLWIKCEAGTVSIKNFNISIDVNSLLTVVL